MNKELHIISVTPSDMYFWWSTRVWLYNLRKYGYSDRARVLVWTPNDRMYIGPHPTWKELEKEYPEAKFFFYNDEVNLINGHIKDINYIPLLRPHVLERHFVQFPELVEGAIYYCDSDTCFMKEPTFLEQYKDDNICYLSYTGNRSIDYNYQNVTYLDGKINDVKPDMLETYKQIDVVGGMLNIFGLQRELAEQKNNAFGGAQYYLKNIDHTFWRGVYNGIIYLRKYLTMNINRAFFESEDKGFQSWCSDMWSIQFNLWRLNKEDATPPEMDFIWATDPIEKWGTTSIYHDAGAGFGSIAYIDGSEQFLFFKRKMEYVNNIKTPFDDDLSFVSNKYCSYNYVKEILAAKDVPVMA